MDGSLLLANGEGFKGHWLGEPKTVTEELIFFTGMTRFEEFITDPLAKGKIVVATYPGIFNGKINEKRFESGAIQIGGLITGQEPAEEWYTLFEKAGVPVLVTEETRALIKTKNKAGELLAIMASGVEAPSKSRTTADNLQPAAVVPEGSRHLVLIDFGASKSLLRFLAEEGYKVTAVHPDTNADSIKELAPDGIVFSGGPAQPGEYTPSLKAYGEIAKALPVIAFGLGSQLVAAAFGAKVEKLSCGHRGFAVPVIELETDKIFMTKQNHLFSLKENSMQLSGLLATHRNVMDRTIEGYKHAKYPVLGFQFHVDPAVDLSFAKKMFHEFSKMIKESKGATVYA